MEKQQPILITVPATKDSHRWVAITALLLAIGMILHTISPNIGGITPNWTIAMYSITIALTRPSLTRAMGIGFVAGLTIVPSSKSAFPLGNIASEIVGGLTACILVKAFLLTHLDNFKFKGFVIGGIATAVSGGTFTYILHLVMKMPLNVWITMMLPLVGMIALLNGIVTQVLYGPVKKLFFMQGGRKNG